ncbi:LysR family transcriptional regulator [Viridibacillus sp. NPDC093762]|uniref:LysR family transcriptional regulator n=1 Tax=Viridibacillus sp. NPDC093762 TaxID=3390720 RepID=UPI003D071DDC
MELKWVKTFITAAETENFRIAAEQLFISQPSITVHIQQLEDFLGVQLFKRNHTQIQLTKEGKQFYKSATTIINMVDESKREIRLFATQSKILLTVALSPLLVETNLPNLIYQFSTDFPQYEIEIIVEDSKYIDDVLLSDKSHLAICIDKSNHATIHSEKIGSSTLQLIYPLNHSDDETVTYNQFQELTKKYPLFTGHLEEAIQIGTLLDSQFPTLRKMKITQSHIIKRFVKDGLGMAFLPKFIIYNGLKEKEFKSLHFDLFLLPTVDLYMRYDKENEKIHPLLQLIRNNFINI